MCSSYKELQELGDKENKISLVIMGDLNIVTMTFGHPTYGRHL